MDLSEAAKILGRQPKPKNHSRTCPVCGKVFMTTAKGQFCSSLCRYRRYNATARKSRRATEPLPRSEEDRDGA